MFNLLLCWHLLGFCSVAVLQVIILLKNRDQIETILDQIGLVKDDCKIGKICTVCDMLHICKLVSLLVILALTSSF